MLLTERYAPQIAGVLSCWDRILVFGTLPKVCFAEGMTSYLYEHKIRIFDYPRFAEPFRNVLRENAERLAGENGVQIEFLRKRNVRKEDRVKQILTKRGNHPGLVCICRRWSPARPTNPGTTRTPARPTCCTTTASACTTTSISSTKSWDWATCGCRPGCRADCRSTSTDTVGWPACQNRLPVAGQCVGGNRRLGTCPANR